ncbi:hypothetical protein QFC21_002010 [Naganishia friedmannii]|uniref:Uncharacterized protein n=1 Tax=Naganishia friedmannii TaxID=89922 RepID=A0ACC2VYF6_9TREE|nr:hypothetical protein QFC21_002010 [Naganishia friedmannii]
MYTSTTLLAALATLAQSSLAASVSQITGSGGQCLTMSTHGDQQIAIGAGAHATVILFQVANPSGWGGGSSAPTTVSMPKPILRLAGRCWFTLALARRLKLGTAIYQGTQCLQVAGLVAETQNCAPEVDPPVFTPPFLFDDSSSSAGSSSTVSSGGILGGGVGSVTSGIVSQTSTLASSASSAAGQITSSLASVSSSIASAISGASQSASSTVWSASSVIAGTQSSAQLGSPSAVQSGTSAATSAVSAAQAELLQLDKPVAAQVESGNECSSICYFCPRFCS